MSAIDKVAKLLLSNEQSASVRGIVEHHYPNLPSDWERQFLTNSQVAFEIFRAGFEDFPEVLEQINDIGND